MVVTSPAHLDTATDSRLHSSWTTAGLLHLAILLSRLAMTGGNNSVLARPRHNRTCLPRSSARALHLPPVALTCGRRVVGVWRLART